MRHLWVNGPPPVSTPPLPLPTHLLHLCKVTSAACLSALALPTWKACNLPSHPMTEPAN